MAYTQTQELALDYSRSQATADQVIDAVKASKPAEPQWSGKSLDDYLARMETDDVNEPNLNGWDGIVALFNQDALSEEQFDELSSLYLKKG